MDLKNIKSFIANHRRNGTTIKQAADRLAPLEEQIEGLIVVGEENFKASADLVEESGKVGWRELLHFEPVAVIILLSALGFIAFIAWQISLMPLKTN